MSVFLDKQKSDRLSSYMDRSVSVKQRISQLVNSLGEFNPNPYLSEILKNIQGEEHVLTNAYRAISDEIKENMFQLLTEINECKVEALKIDCKLLEWQTRLNKCCSIYSKVPPLLEHKDDENYSLFLESYERGIQLSQQISELNFKIVDLVDVQKVLDNAFAGELIELEYLTSRLSELIRSFRFVKTPQLMESYRNKFCSLKDLYSLIERKEKEFEELHNKMEKVRDKKQGSFEKNFEESESMTIGMGRNLFDDTNKEKV